MITNATVVEVLGSIAVVEAERKSACDGCHKRAEGENCSVCSLLGGNRKIRASAYNKIGARVGDTVEVESSSGLLMLYAAIIFLLPVIFAVLSYFVAQAFGADEDIRLICVAVAFVTVTVIDIFVSRAVGKRRCDLNIVKIIEK